MAQGATDRPRVPLTNPAPVPAHAEHRLVKLRDRFASCLS